jgi:GTPase SAR1 family protein
LEGKEPDLKSQKSTLGIDMFAVKVPLEDITVELIIWDTAGQEKYFSLTKSK